MSETESQQEQFVTVEAPLKIMPGQNLYDQPPFNLVFANLALTSGLDINQIRVLAYSLSRHGNEFLDELENSNGSGALYAQRLTKKIVRGDRPWELRSVGVKRIPVAEGREASRAILRDLSAYPWWFRYITRKIDQFNKDGSWNKSIMAPIPVDSYAVWAKKELERNKTAVSIGIEEVFPQDFRTTSTSIIVSRELVAKGITSLGVFDRYPLK